MSGTFYTPLDLIEKGSDPASPPSGLLRVYAKTDGNVYAKDSSGNIIMLSNELSGAGVANQVVIWSDTDEIDGDAELTYDPTVGLLNVEEGVTVTNYSPVDLDVAKPYFLGDTWDAVGEVWNREFIPRQLSADDLVGGVGLDNINGVGEWQIAHGSGFAPTELVQSTDLVYKTGNLGVGTDDPVSKMDLSVTNLGATQNNTSGFVLKSLTAATSGNQQISPALRFRGFGWKTDATAASQPVDFRAYVLPVQGSAAPSGNLVFQSSINGGSYTDRLVITSAGNVGIGTTSPTANLHLEGTSTLLNFRRTSSSENFTVNVNSSRVLLFSKPTGTVGSSQNTSYRFSGTGHVGATDGFWNGFQIFGHIVTESAVNRFPAMTIYSTSTVEADPTDLEFRFDVGNTFTIPNSLGFFMHNQNGSFIRFGRSSSTEYMRITDVGNVGIGTNNPAANLHIANTNPAVIRLQRTATNGIFEIAQNNEVTSTMKATNTGSGNAIIDFDPIPSDGTSNALFRFFRATNSTGVVALQILRGNNTAGQNAQISGNGDSYLNGVVGNVGIGHTATPSSKLDVVGDIEIDSASAFYLGDPTTNDSWRITRSGNNLVMQRRESGTWVTKQTISA